MDIIIREMRQDEASDIKKLCRKAFNFLEVLALTKPKTAFVATIDDEIVGAVVYKLYQGRDKKIGYIDYVFVDPKCAGQGIGALLLEEAFQFLWESGCYTITALIKDDNVSSWKLFEKHGFVNTGIPKLIKELGIAKALKLYFISPYCVGIGMEYYVASREQSHQSGKTVTAKQILTYLLVNLIIFGVLSSWRFADVKTAIIAFAIILCGGILFEYVGTLFSKQKWLFRFTNGGALLSVLITFFSIFPMIGNWYPTNYENTPKFKRDIGVGALLSWIFLLMILLLSYIFLHYIYSHDPSHPEYLMTILIIMNKMSVMSATLLIYRCLPFYPFESYGGRRVYNWSKTIFIIMVLITLTAIIYFLFNRGFCYRLEWYRLAH